MTQQTYTKEKAKLIIKNVLKSLPVDIQLTIKAETLVQICVDAGYVTKICDNNKIILKSTLKGVTEKLGE